MLYVLLIIHLVTLTQSAKKGTFIVTYERGGQSGSIESPTKAVKNEAGIYGQQDTYETSNIPSSRYGVSVFTTFDENSHEVAYFWGGQFYHDASKFGTRYLQELWAFDLVTKQYKCVKGHNCAGAGLYGNIYDQEVQIHERTKLEFHIFNVPMAGSFFSTFVAPEIPERYILFSGIGPVRRVSNTMWEYSTSRNMFRWLHGSLDTDNIGVMDGSKMNEYGEAYYPKSRAHSCSFLGNDQVFGNETRKLVQYIFGGIHHGKHGQILSDFWAYSFELNQFKMIIHSGKIPYSDRFPGPRYGCAGFSNADRSMGFIFSGTILTGSYTDLYQVNLTSYSFSKIFGTDELNQDEFVESYAVATGMNAPGFAEYWAPMELPQYPPGSDKKRVLLFPSYDRQNTVTSNVVWMYKMELGFFQYVYTLRDTGISDRSFTTPFTSPSESSEFYLFGGTNMFRETTVDCDTIDQYISFNNIFQFTYSPTYECFSNFANDTSGSVCSGHGVCVYTDSCRCQVEVFPEFWGDDECSTCCVETPQISNNQDVFFIDLDLCVPEINILDGYLLTLCIIFATLAGLCLISLAGSVFVYLICKEIRFKEGDKYVQFVDEPGDGGEEREDDSSSEVGSDDLDGIEVEMQVKNKRDSKKFQAFEIKTTPKKEKIKSEEEKEEKDEVEKEEESMTNEKEDVVETEQPVEEE